MAEELLLLEEVARECRASISSVRHWLATGRLRSVRPGKRRLVRRVELERFLDGGAVGQAHAGRQDGDA